MTPRMLTPSEELGTTDYLIGLPGFNTRGMPSTIFLRCLHSRPVVLVSFYVSLQSGTRFHRATIQESASFDFAGLELRSCPHVRTKHAGGAYCCVRLLRV